MVSRVGPHEHPRGYGILRLKNWRVWGTEEAVDEVEPAKYTGIYASGVGLALPQIIADSNNVLSPMLLDASFEVPMASLSRHRPSAHQ